MSDYVVYANREEDRIPDSIKYIKYIIPNSNTYIPGSTSYPFLIRHVCAECDPIKTLPTGSSSLTSLPLNGLESCGCCPGQGMLLVTRSPTSQLQWKSEVAGAE